jgi:hypothetical protein
LSIVAFILEQAIARLLLFRKGNCCDRNLYGSRRQPWSRGRAGGAALDTAARSAGHTRMRELRTRRRILVPPKGPETIAATGAMSRSRWLRSPFRETCSPTSCGWSQNCGRRPLHRLGNAFGCRALHQTTGDVRLDDRKFGIPRRATASRLAAKRIYKPRLAQTTFQSVKVLLCA